jgi:hypothetical protein
MADPVMSAPIMVTSKCIVFPSTKIIIFRELK